MTMMTIERSAWKNLGFLVDYTHTHTVNSACKVNDSFLKLAKVWSHFFLFFVELHIKLENNNG